VEAWTEGALVQGIWGPVSRYTVAKPEVGKASQIEGAEIEQDPYVRHMVELVELSS
jgi:hypothetical protein